MADIKVELNGEDVNRAIADAIVKSVLGTTIVKMVDEYVRNISNNYNNPVKLVIEQQAKDMIAELLLARREVICAEVEKQLSGEVTDRIVAAGIEKGLKGW